MKSLTKIILFASIIILVQKVSAGPHFSNGGDQGAGPWQKHSVNQLAEKFFATQTNMSETELNVQNELWQRKKSGFLPRTPLSSQINTYSQLSEDQKDIYDVLYAEAQHFSGYYEQTKDFQKGNIEALTAKKQIPLFPWRKIDGKIVYVLSHDSGFNNCGGTVIQTFDGGVLIKRLGNLGEDFYIKNFPFQVADGDELDSAQIMVIMSGLKKFKTVLGDERTVSAADFGSPCDKPTWGDKIESDAQQPTDYQKKELKDIEDAIAESKRIEDASIKRVADFLSSIESQKQMTVETMKTNQKNAKNKALQYNLDLAEKGDAYGLMRMGERYRDGEGVEKDLVTAKAYLQKASDAGSVTASNELESLNSH